MARPPGCVSAARKERQTRLEAVSGRVRLWHQFVGSAFAKRTRTAAREGVVPCGRYVQYLAIVGSSRAGRRGPTAPSLLNGFEMRRKMSASQPPSSSVRAAGQQGSTRKPGADTRDRTSRHMQSRAVRNG